MSNAAHRIKRERLLIGERVYQTIAAAPVICEPDAWYCLYSGTATPVYVPLHRWNGSAQRTALHETS